MKRVLAIGGTDPTAGAGIQADLKAISANGGYGMTVITTLVAQNTRGVKALHPVPAAFVREQLDAVSDDVVIDAVKIGLVGDNDVVAEISRWIDRVRPPVVVLDPVRMAGSGHALTESPVDLTELLERIDLVTPNLRELEELTGATGADWAGMLDQAVSLASRFDTLVLVKGGHLGGPTSPDALVDATGVLIELDTERAFTLTTHGTGCSLASAIATNFARTGDWPLALCKSKAWLAESIRRGSELGVGTGNGPIHHFWRNPEVAV